MGNGHLYVRDDLVRYGLHNPAAAWVVEVARQIVFVLKDKIEIEDVWAGGPTITDADSEVVSALTSLGYSLSEAQASLRALPPEAQQQPLEERVRLALSNLSRL